MTSRQRAYSYVRAFAALFLGYHHLHVLDDVRVKRQREYFSWRAIAARYADLLRTKK
jgi:hypothetical protein